MTRQRRDQEQEPPPPMASLFIPTPPPPPSPYATPSPSNSSNIRRKSDSLVSDFLESKVAVGVPSDTLPWHDVITKQDWEQLEQMLKSYNVHLYRKKTPSASDVLASPSSSKKKPQRKLRVLKYLPTIGRRQRNNDGNNNDDDDDDDNPPISPLLHIDRTAGQTPLHVACNTGMVIPEKLLLKLIFVERKASTVVDNNGNLALHLALRQNHNTTVLDKLIRAHPPSLIQPGQHGWTPLRIAIYSALQQLQNSNSNSSSNKNNNSNNNNNNNYKDQNSSRHFHSWSVPMTEQQSSWQNNQKEIWSVAWFILDHMVVKRRNTKLMEENIDFLLQALDTGAPPNVVKLLIVASFPFLKKDIKQWNKALQLAIQLQYPISIQHEIVIACPGKGNSAREAMRQTVVEQFWKGQKLTLSPPLDHEIEETTTNNTNVDVVDDGAVTFYDILLMHTTTTTTTTTSELPPHCKEWWNQLKYAITIGARGVPSSSSKRLDLVGEDYLLHAVLSIPQSPPSLILMLLELFPHARTDIDPWTGAFPLHLACQQWNYNCTAISDTFNNNNNNNNHQNKKKEPTMEFVLQKLILDNADFVTIPYKDRLPLHHALASGKPSNFIMRLVQYPYMDTMMDRDPLTKLYPFQMAALPQSNNDAMTYESNNDNNNNKNSNLDQNIATQSDQLTTIYYLIRTFPPVINHARGVIRTSSTGNNKYRGLYNKVAIHYLEWCYYIPTEFGNNNSRKPRHDTIALLQNAIHNGKIPLGMERWWINLQVLIWYCCSNYDKSIIPKQQDDAFLLHAALSNPDTPPMVIQLLLAMYPLSVTLPLPLTGEYPLHIACRTPSYVPVSWENNKATTTTKNNFNKNILQSIIQAYPKAVMIKETCNGRLPLHVAIYNGKPFSDLCHLIVVEPCTLAVPDSITRLVPFQLMAAATPNSTTTTTTSKIQSCSNNNKNASILSKEQIHSTQKLITPQDNFGSTTERGIVLRNYLRKYHQDVLTSIYVLLRASPGVLSNMTFTIIEVPPDDNDEKEKVAAETDLELSKSSNIDGFSSSSTLNASMFDLMFDTTLITMMMEAELDEIIVCDDDDDHVK